MSLRKLRNTLGLGLRRDTPGDGCRLPWTRGIQFAQRLSALVFLTFVLASCSTKTPQSALDPHGLVARNQIDLFYTTVWVSLFIFICVGGTMAVVVWKYRERPGDENKPMPAQGHGNPLIEVGLITGSIALLVIIAIPTLKSIWLTDALPTDQPYWKPSLLGNWYPQAGGTLPDIGADEPLEITVKGYQWWWGFEYTQFGTTTTTANEMVIPAGKVIKLNLRSNNVIHSFWLPKIAGKVDLIPGRANWMWIMADDDAKTYENGLYYGQCAQYCGEAHAFMLFRARVVSDADFVKWIEATQAKVKAPGEGGDWAKFTKAANQDKNPADLATPAQRGAALFFGRANCLQCHTVNGSSANGVLGPNLTRVASRTSIAAGFLDNLDNTGTATIDPARQKANFVQWITHPYDVKPGNLMWYPQPGTTTGGLRDVVAANKANGTPLTDQDYDDIASFLMTLK